MAERRMISKKITDTDAFLDMPLSTQALYFHLLQNADDEGFVGSPKSIIRKIGANKNDYDLLIVKRFIIEFESGICVIKHWYVHNYIAKDRFNETTYLEEKKQLSLKNNKVYTECIQDVENVYTQVSIGKVSIDKESTINSTKEKSTRFVPPTLDEVSEYCKSRNNGVNPQHFIDFYESKGWYVGKNKMKDWKASIRTWEKKEKPKKDEYDINREFSKSAYDNMFTSIDDLEL